MLGISFLEGCLIPYSFIGGCLRVAFLIFRPMYTYIYEYGYYISVDVRSPGISVVIHAFELLYYEVLRIKPRSSGRADSAPNI